MSSLGSLSQLSSFLEDRTISSTIALVAGHSWDQLLHALLVVLVSSGSLVLPSTLPKASDGITRDSEGVGRASPLAREFGMNVERMFSANAHSTSVQRARWPFSVLFCFRSRARARAASAKLFLVVKNSMVADNTLMMLSNSPILISQTSFVPIALVRRDVFQLFTPRLLRIDSTRET
jgi:hypothetical protein